MTDSRYADAYRLSSLTSLRVYFLCRWQYHILVQFHCRLTHLHASCLGPWRLICCGLSQFKCWQGCIVVLFHAIVCVPLFLNSHIVILFLTMNEWGVSHPGVNGVAFHPTRGRAIWTRHTNITHLRYTISQTLLWEPYRMHVLTVMALLWPISSWS